jgi:sulfatase modifying factor 1
MKTTGEKKLMTAAIGTTGCAMIAILIAGSTIYGSGSGTTLEKMKIDASVSCVQDVSGSGTGVVSSGDFQPTKPNIVLRVALPPENMVWIPGGEFSMGAADPSAMEDGGHERMEDARPVHRVYVDGFYMDAAEVTNAQFAAFVHATGYKTVAEQRPTPEEFPDAPAENLVAGSVVFTPPREPVALDNRYQWWDYVHGADWRHPTGPGSSIVGKENYPVVQIAWEDAAAYAIWAGKRLPTEAEWEFAARGGKAGQPYSWGNQLRPDGRWMANTFQGHFPNRDDGTDGFAGIAPIKQYPPNDYGLYDMEGNVWEWCRDWYSEGYYRQLAAASVVRNPQGPDVPYDPGEPGVKKKVQRGGSFLCTDQYCARYILGSRGKGEWRSGANHIGFRCIKYLDK